MAVTVRTVREGGIVTFAKAPHRIMGYDPRRHGRDVWIKVDRYGCPLKACAAHPRDYPDSAIGKVVEIMQGDEAIESAVEFTVDGDKGFYRSDGVILSMAPLRFRRLVDDRQNGMRDR